MIKFQLSLGALSPPLKDQLAGQGFEAPPKELQIAQRASKSITYLSIHAYITERDKLLAQRRLIKRLQKHIRQRINPRQRQLAEDSLAQKLNKGVKSSRKATAAMNAMAERRK